MQRRGFALAAFGLGLDQALAALPVPANPAALQRARVVVVGGGYGGATAAKYLRTLSGHRLEVVLVEPHPAFVSCPMSNLVIGGSKRLIDITTGYEALTRRHGVRLVRDSVTGIDPQRKTLTLTRGPQLRYDKLVLSPGVALMFDQIEGLQAAHDAGQILQAWSAGMETLALRRQLEAMPDDGVFAISIPLAPYRCPPAPYERASLVASYFQQHKPRARVLVLDANPDLTAQGALFRNFWTEHYGDTLEYRPEHSVVAVDGARGVLSFEVQDDVHANVLNVLPPMRAGTIAMRSGLATVNARWCDVHYQTFASTQAPDIHVLGDAVMAAPLMPKSGHMAHSQAKVAAAAIVAELSGQPVDPAPWLRSTCFTHVSTQLAMHLRSVHRYDTATATYQPVAALGSLSQAPSSQEAREAEDWAHSIWRDMLR